jgi:deoxyhypusine monooxygenase
MTVTVSPSESDLEALEASLLNKSGSVPLHTRFRALFTLKALKSEDAVHIISQGL